MRDIKFEIMFKVTNSDFTTKIVKHYTTLDRLIDGRDTMNYDDIEIVAKRQFAGSTDKNGVDIYEDDVIDVQYNYIGKVVVKFKDGKFNVSGFCLAKCEVVGNIHENPELIGG